jgi:prephenate dehydrogenase
LADSSADLWAEIIDSNAPEIVAVLDRLSDDLDIVRAVLAERSLHDHDSATSLEPIRNVIERGNAGRAVLPDKHGGTAHVYESVPVVVADKPGELGRLFAAAGQAGVNLEDVRIEHTVGRLRAIIDLLVTPEHAVRLRQVLAEGGWQIRG